MKKVLAIILVIAVCAVFVTSLAACNDKSDWEKIQESGELVIGITYFKPMNYYDGETLVGFETEFATAVCSILGLTPKFQEINWNNKIVELQSGTIDVIWNGMTINQEYYANMEISNAYMTNRQVAIINKSNASVYTDIASMNDAKLGAEQQSAGEKAIRANATLADNEIVTLTAQQDVLNELKSGTIDVGFIDIVMATASVGEGTDYADLMIVDNAMIGDDELYGKLLATADEARNDADVISFNYLSGESITEVVRGAPAVFRRGDRPFALSSFVRSLLYSAVATLSIGMEVLRSENISVDSIAAHGGFCKSKQGLRALSAALDAPICAYDTAGEGGAWGMAALAAYAVSGKRKTLPDYLDEKVFASRKARRVRASKSETESFQKYLELYKKLILVEKEAEKIYE